MKLVPFLLSLVLFVLFLSYGEFTSKGKRSPAVSIMGAVTFISIWLLGYWANS